MENELLYHATELFMDAMYQDLGLTYLVDLAAELLGNPVYLIDVADRIIAACKQMKEADTYMRPMIDSGYLSDAESTGMSATNTKKKIYNTQSPFIAERPAKSGGGSFIFAPVRIKGELIAYACCMGINHRHTEADIQVMSVVSKALSVELQKSRIYQDSAGTKLGYQLLDAISLNPTKQQSKSGTFTNWNPKEYSYFISISLPLNSQDARQRSIILLHIFKEAFSGSIVALSNDGISILLTSDTAFVRNSEKYIQIQELLSLHNIHAGCSQQILDFSQLRRYSEESLEAVTLGELFSPFPSIIHFEDIFFYRILQLIENKIPLKSLCYPNFIKLEEYDSRKQTDYCDTLIKYLSNSKDVALTTEALRIHKNTLYYRLNKIENILGSDLNDINIVFRILFTIRIENYLKHEDNL